MPPEERPEFLHRLRTLSAGLPIAAQLEWLLTEPDELIQAPNPAASPLRSLHQASRASPKRISTAESWLSARFLSDGTWDKTYGEGGATLNKAPRSKLRGITELKYSELPEIVVGLPLPLHRPFDRLPVRSLPPPSPHRTRQSKIPRPTVLVPQRVSVESFLGL